MLGFYDCEPKEVAMSTATPVNVKVLLVLLAFSSHSAPSGHFRSRFSSRTSARRHEEASQQQTKRAPSAVTPGQSSSNWLHPSNEEYRQAIHDGYALKDISEAKPTFELEDIQSHADAAISIRSPLNCAKVAGFTYAQKLRGEPLLADVHKACDGRVSIDVTHFSRNLGKNWPIVLKHGTGVLQPVEQRLDKSPSVQTYQDRAGYYYFDEYTFTLPKAWTDEVTVIWSDDDGARHSKTLDFSSLAHEQHVKSQPTITEIEKEPAVPAVTAKYDAFKDLTMLTLSMDVSSDADLVLKQSCKGNVQGCVLVEPALRNPALFIFGRTDNVPDVTTVYPLLFLIDGERVNLGNMGCKFSQFVGSRVEWQCYMTPYVSDFLRVVHGRDVQAQIAGWEFRLTAEQLAAMKDFGRRLGYE